MGEVFTTERRVEFRDTDSARIVHFSVFFTYMEQAEHELLRSLKLAVMMELDGTHIGFPRVNAECNYRSPIKFEDIVDVRVVVKRIGSKSVTYGFDFLCGDRVIADGHITAVCCDLDGDRPVAIEIPSKIADELRRFLVDDSS